MRTTAGEEVTDVPFNDTYQTPADHIEELAFFVPGTPASKGSKSQTRTGHMYEADKKLPTWTRAVTTAAVETLYGRPGFGGAPVQIQMWFRFPRPKTVTRTHHTVKPDVDKTTRAVLDALTKAGVWDDDCKVVSQTSAKRYAADDEPAGVRIVVRRFE